MLIQEMKKILLGGRRGGTMENWTGWTNEEYPDCEHFNELVNECITALDKIVLERYPNKNEGPHMGFYYQEQPDGVPIMPCGGAVRCTFRMWGELMAKIASKRDKEIYSYMDFAWT